MADRLLRAHIQSPVGLWAWMTLSYNMGSVVVAGSVCVHESPGTWLWQMMGLIAVSQCQ